MRTGAALAVLCLATATLASCRPLATPPPAPPTAIVSPLPSVLPSSAPMAWIHIGGATAVGPSVDGGTLVLMGGRRAIVTPSGEVVPERVRCPEALTDVEAMVTRSGRQVVVALGTETVYRFDEPLGAPVPVVKIDPGRPPGAPRAKLAGSADGRARLVLPELRACARREPCDGLATVDVETGEHQRGPWQGPPHEDPDPAPPTATDLTLRWIQQARTDPVLAAITSGMSFGPGEALAVSGRTAATVSLATGRVLDLVTLVEAFQCSAIRAGREVWIVCEVLRSTGERIQAVRRASANPLTLTRIAGGEVIAPFQARNRGSAMPFSDGRSAFLRRDAEDYEVGVRSDDGSETVLTRLPPAYRPIRLMTQDDPQRVRVLGQRRDGRPEVASVDAAGHTTFDPASGLPCAADACAFQLDVGETHGIALRLDWGLAAWDHRPPPWFVVTIAAAAVTRDGGRSFSPLRVPPDALDGGELRRAGGLSSLHASDVGMVVGRMARVGWDPADDAASGE